VITSGHVKKKETHSDGKKINPSGDSACACPDDSQQSSPSRVIPGGFVFGVKNMEKTPRCWEKLKNPTGGMTR